MQLVLVRHALPERIDGTTDGTADPPLTELGERQAARVADALAGGGAGPVSGLYASPMARARATAAPLAAALGVAPRIVPELREYDADAAQYVPVHEMARLDPAGFARLRDGLLPAHVDVAAFGDRVEAALAAIVAAHPGRETAMVVVHAGVINVWLARELGIDRPLPFPLDYAGITRVLVGRDGRRSVRSVNETAHVADLLAMTAGAE